MFYFTVRYTGSISICGSPLFRLLSPHGLGGLPDQLELVPLFRLGQLIADFAGGTNRKYFMKFRNKRFTWREFVIL